MIWVALSIAAIIIVGLRMSASAPMGWQDATGFHLGEPNAAHHTLNQRGEGENVRGKTQFHGSFDK